MRINGEVHKENCKDPFDVAESDAHYLPMIEDITYYDMIEVRPNAEAKEIERAFRRDSRTCHPEKYKRSTRWDWELIKI